MSKAKKTKLKIPLDFKQTVMAALETKPEQRKKSSGGRKERRER
ncbi:MAG: hypothetical protein WBZ11_07800 [Candidatus Sulfotelmatobacter sp.]|jgi:hypothetical protein